MYDADGLAHVTAATWHGDDDQEYEPYHNVRPTTRRPVVVRRRGSSSGNNNSRDRESQRERVQGGSGVDSKEGEAAAAAASQMKDRELFMMRVCLCRTQSYVPTVISTKQY